MTAERTENVIEIDTASSKFGAGVELWKVADLPEYLDPPCWAIIAARLLLSRPFEEAVASFLEYIGLAAGADRAWTLRFNDDTTLLRNANEWCRPGVSSHVLDLHNVPVTMLGEMLTPLREGRSVAINDVSALPRALRTMQIEFKRQQIRSTLSVPVLHDDGRLIACIGLDRTRALHRWSDEEVHALMQIAALMGVATTEGAPSRRPKGEAFSIPVYLQSGRSMRGVPLASISAVRADMDGSMVGLRDGAQIPDDRPLRWWQSVLPETDFLRVHRSAVVNIRSVELIRKRSGSQDLELLVAGCPTPTPVARMTAAELRRRLGV